jgi:hypothetical protein
MKLFRRLLTNDRKIEVEKSWLTKSSGWVGVKAVLCAAYSNQKPKINYFI